MSFVEKVKEFGRSTKKFLKEHWKEALLVTGGAAVTGVCFYGVHKLRTSNLDDDQIYLGESSGDTVEDRTAWNRDWDEIGRSFERATHQPFGSFENGVTEEEGYVDPWNGNCFIVAGPNSLYNESPNNIYFYVLDNEGYYHKMPDDLYT